MVEVGDRRLAGTGARLRPGSDLVRGTGEPMRGLRRAPATARRMADVYDDWYGDVSDVDAATVRGLAALAGRGPVLELGVGTGRLALPLAAAGLEVHGIDASARPCSSGCGPSRAADAIHRHHRRHGRRPAAPARSPLVFVAYNTLLQPDVGRGRAAGLLRARGRRLAPGGRFVVEAFVPGRAGPQRATTSRCATSSVDRVVLVRRPSTTPTPSVAEGQFVELTEAAAIRLRPWAIRWADAGRSSTPWPAAAGLALDERCRGLAGRRRSDRDSASHVSCWRRP